MSYYSGLNDDLTNPNSPYYLGAPSSLEQINNYLHGTHYGYNNNPYYNTNFLGKVNNRFITPLRADQVEIQGRIAERRRKEGLSIGVAAAIAGVASLLIFRKTANFVKGLPLIGKLFK